MGHALLNDSVACDLILNPYIHPAWILAWMSVTGFLYSYPSWPDTAFSRSSIVKIPDFNLVCIIKGAFCFWIKHDNMALDIDYKNIIHALDCH